MNATLGSKKESGTYACTVSGFILVSYNSPSVINQISRCSTGILLLKTA